MEFLELNNDFEYFIHVGRVLKWGVLGRGSPLHSFIEELDGNTIRIEIIFLTVKTRSKFFFLAKIRDITWYV